MSAPGPGPVVTVAAGVGCPPAPRGGLLTAGDYVLIAETVYGAQQPHVFGRPGDTTQAHLGVSCDQYQFSNAIWSSNSPTGGSGGATYCGRLVPQAVSLVALSPSLTGGNPDQSLQLDAPYTATGSALTLIRTGPYDDTTTGETVGWTTIVDEYVLATSKAASNPPLPAMSASAPPNEPARDPRCPATLPAASAPCNPVTGQPLECEYGGDAYAQCTTIARCSLQADDTFQFELEENVNCVSSDPSCPASYADVPLLDAGYVEPGGVFDGGACTPTTTVTCTYPEAVCVCAEPAASAGCTCRMRSEVSDDDGQDSACPAKRPLAGDACAVEGAWCLYDGFCGGISLGQSMTCQGGYWETDMQHFSCPARSGC